MKLRPWPPEPRLPLIKVVGVSASGKSRLTAGLRAAGYDARPVSQEHSNVPTLWQRFGFTHALIFLDVSLEAQRARRPDVAWSATIREEELTRLAHAREHADFVINTSSIAPGVVLALALAWLQQREVLKSTQPLPPVPATGSAHPAHGTSRMEYGLDDDADAS